MRLHPRSDLIEAYIRQFRNDNTRTAYANDLRAFARFALNRSWITPRLMKQITPQHLSDYMRFLAESPVSFSTITRRLSVLERFFTWAAQEGHADRTLYEALHAVFRDYVRQLHHLHTQAA